MSGRFWTMRELAELRRRYPHEPTTGIARELGRSVAATYNMAGKLGLVKSVEYLASPAAHRINPHNTVSVAHRFTRGHVPFNKGKHHKPAGSEKGWFKKGQLNGAAKAKELPVGSERVSDGVLLRKMGMCLNRWTRWQPVHRMVWKAANGTVPRGCIVVFKPGMHTTNAAEITIDRLECITRRENMLRNSRHTRYGPELNQLMQLRGALKRKIRNREERLYEKHNARRA